MTQRTPGVPSMDDPLWHKDAVIYEIHVRAFFDADGDGVGDFEGLTQKLDYLQQLGVTTLWLLPFYPSPLRDDGYDIADYKGIHPLYGKLKDFALFLKEAHRRGLKVITELVINHTSDQHAWFQRARRAPAGSHHRDFYVWSDKPEKYRDARIIFKDFEHSNWTYDPVAKSYYWHRFYSHQPDLNFDNPAVKRAVFQVMDFWCGMGVDGLRLDAVPYLYEREGTDCENLPETHGFLKELRSYLDKRYPNRILLAEANQWPEDAAAYFGAGDEAHMNFHFPLMPRLFMSIHMEDRFPVIDILQQTPVIPDNCQWGLFLRNHDELTLEMVTDEERDYMYRVYASDQRMRVNLGIRRRLAPLLGNNRRRIELMNALLFALPGTPFLYYGDELGMGDNVYLGDRNGVRTPMQWSADRNAGFSRANPQSLYLPVIIDPEYHFESVNVEAQLNNPHSLLWWMKRVIGLRKRYRAFGRGSIEFLFPENRKILAFVRRHEDESILMVANLSRFSQFVRLDLRSFQGMAPVELFGRNEFPVIEDAPYVLSLGPYSFYWFVLRKPAMAETRAEAALPELSVAGGWESILQGKGVRTLEEILPAWIRDRRWFGGKTKKLDAAEIVESIVLPYDDDGARLLFVQLTYTDGDPETYLLPVGFVEGEAAARMEKETPHAVIARLRVSGRDGAREGVLCDAAHDPAFASALLEGIDRRRHLKGRRGSAALSRTRSFRKAPEGGGEPMKPHVGRAEQSNTSIIFGNSLILKLYRRLHEGINPDIEIGEFLTERARFEHVPKVAGHIVYQGSARPPMALGVLSGFVPNEGDAWHFTVDEVEHFLERAASRYSGVAEIPRPSGKLLDLAREEIPDLAREMMGPYLEPARLLGRRTAEMHSALASDADDPDFHPEPFTPFYQRALYQSMRNLTMQVFQTLRKSSLIPAAAREDAGRVLAQEAAFIGWFRSTLERRISAQRIRTHGDYHLGQVLYTGRDFVIIDFEGEPARALEERRVKRSPLRDVAGMIRSFHYAAYTALVTRAERRVSSEEEKARLSAWTFMWHRYATGVFLAEYLRTLQGSPLLKGSKQEEIATLLDLYRLEKAIYELGYELNNRPDWVRIPLTGILQIVQESFGRRDE